MKHHSARPDSAAISSTAAARQSSLLALLQVDGEDCYWLASQPHNAGRITLMRHRHGDNRELLPAAYSIKSRVYEYGGGAYAVRDGLLVFCNEHDQRLYRLQPDSATVTAITAAQPALRYGDLHIDPMRKRVICVREQLRDDAEALVELVAIDLQAPFATTLIDRGADFYSSPRISPDGRNICWLSWQHPHMPWDETTLCHATLNAAGEPGDIHHLHHAAESILQPSWSPDNRLYFISDRNNWWNIYRLDDGMPRAMLERDADFARPPWVFGLSTYAFLSAQQLLCCHNDAGNWVLNRLNTDNGQVEAISRAFAEITHLQASAAQACFIGAGLDCGQGIQRYQPEQHSFQQLDAPPLVALPAEQFSPPCAITYRGEDGHSGHALLYRPQRPLAEPPPLLVMAHGGPTSQWECAFDIRVQFWTSQGYAVCAVNYAGSSGYGRAYRKRLDKQWGLLDASDCIQAARELVANHEVDAQRIAIRGHSAGGYTVLCALTFHDFFHAGVSYYGISDIIRLYHETHKFESQYIDSLIGPYPQSEALYRQRSPLYHYQRMNCPILFLQGRKDRVVPPNQAQAMVEALHDRELYSEVVYFDDEGHGFRQAQNIAHALDRELEFYAKVFRLHA